MSLTTVGLVLVVIGVLIWLFATPAGAWVAVLGAVLAIVGALTHR